MLNAEQFLVLENAKDASISKILKNCNAKSISTDGLVSFLLRYLNLNHNHNQDVPDKFEQTYQNLIANVEKVIL